MGSRTPFHTRAGSTPLESLFEENATPEPIAVRGAGP